MSICGAAHNHFETMGFIKIQHGYVARAERPLIISSLAGSS